MRSVKLQNIRVLLIVVLYCTEFSQCRIKLFVPASFCPLSTDHCSLVYDDLAIAILHASLVDDLADGICDDLARKRILDRYDIALDGCVDLGILEGEVAALRGAINQLQSLAIAKRLGADDVAVDEGDVFRIPREIFALYDAVADGDVLRVPESILGVEGRIRDLDVFGVLEGILSVESEIIKLDIAALEKEILACDLGVLDMYAATSPTEFGGYCGAVFEAHILAFAQSLDIKDLAILELSVFAIPKRRADAFV